MNAIVSRTAALSSAIHGARLFSADQRLSANLAD